MSALRNIEERIYRREGLVLFDEIVSALKIISHKSDILAFVRQKKLMPNTGRHERNGYLVYPYFSFYLTEREFIHFGETGRSEVLNEILERFTPEVSFESEFSVAGGCEADKNVVLEIQRLLHAYFVTYELDRCVERSAKLLMKEDPQHAKAVGHHYQTLKRINNEVFNINAIFLSSCDPKSVKIQSTELDASRIPSFNTLEKLFREVELYSQSRTVKTKTEIGWIFVYGIPMRYKSGGLTEATILLSDEEMPVFAIKLNERFLRATVDLLVQRGRQKFELEVQGEILSQLVVQGEYTTREKGESSKSNEFALFCKAITIQLALLTNSHSVTIRRFRQYSNTLDLVAGFIDQKCREPTTEKIHCDPGSSVNAFCFEQTDFDYIYIPDTDNIPYEYQEKGLKTVLHARENTKSEICLPIGKNPLKLGTLNLESSNYAAYELDVDFLTSIAFHISQYWNVMGTADDAWWLSQLSFTHMATHELREFKKNLNDDQRRKIERIISTIAPSFHTRRNEKMTWTLFIDFIQQIHYRFSREPLRTVWTFVGIDESTEISDRVGDSLRVIVRSMLNNASHSDYSRDRITLEKRTVSKMEIAIIHYRSCIYLEPDTVDTLERRFSKPKFGKDGWHFGLFLIGVHARLLGGDVEVDPECRRQEKQSTFGYMVRVPLS